MNLAFILLFLGKIRRKLRAKVLTLVTGYKFGMVGKNLKLYIKPYNKKYNPPQTWSGIRIGDNCWIEAIHSYEGENFNPSLIFGDRLCLSDNVHISCVSTITLGDDILIGSKVYIGDHSHGSYRCEKLSLTPPAKKRLGDVSPIKIGDSCWIGDNAIILAGSEICSGCVIAANSVVKDLKVDKPSIIGGVPAKVLKTFEGEHVY
ncbi:DapH/DapD/GlmU-related protein [Buttiauxella ferragutiae]|uniref:DapH/DapD/GlmU-related protein n=1 Tax=Buttiauxella ferragutiae TaxID=82989 RepID=UPI003523F909